MNRRVHTIKRTGARPYPDRVLVVQCRLAQKYKSESDDTGTLSLHSWALAGGPVVGNTVDWRQHEEGNTLGTLWRHIDRAQAQCHRLHIYSWQAREVVAGVDLWGKIAAGEYTLAGADPYHSPACGERDKVKGDGYVILEGPPTVVCCKRPKSRCVITWLDPQNYGVSDLYSYLPAMPAEVLRREIFAGETWHGNVEPEDIAFGVCEWLDSYWRAISSLGLGGPEQTAASQATQGYRHSYLDDTIEIHDSSPAIKLERAALYGGRCECRFVGTVYSGARPGQLYPTDSDQHAVIENAGTIYHLDVNSLYPSVAVDALLPTKLIGVFDDPPIAMLHRASWRYCIIAECEVTTSYPVVPLRLKDNTVWPVGRFDTVLCGPEIELAERMSDVVKIKRAAIYQGHTIYRRWVTDLYGARVKAIEAGNHALASTIKSILNASFGKWAQLSKRWVGCPDMLAPCPYLQWWGKDNKDGKIEQFRSLAWNVEKLEVQGETAESCPAITAYIHSLGRVRLWELMKAAGIANIYYYDTDSLWVNQRGRDELDAYGDLHETELGMLKIKGQHDCVHFYGRQAYEADGKLTLSGYTHKHVVGTDTQAYAIKAAPLSHYLTHADAPGTDRHIARLRIQRPYEHGHVGPDGWVRPINVSWPVAT